MVPTEMHPVIPLLTFQEVLFQQFYMPVLSQRLIKRVNSLYSLSNHYCSKKLLDKFDVDKVEFVLFLSTFFLETKYTPQGSTN